MLKILPRLAIVAALALGGGAIARATGILDAEGGDSSAAACGGNGESQATRTPVAGTTAPRAAQPSWLPRGAEPVHLDPAKFTARIDNPYWPMTPGSRWVYRETDAKGNVRRVEVTVTHRTKTILGIETRVVHDVVMVDNGQVKEDTFDWYAQDAEGNIWYFGEETKTYEKRKVSTEGSWQAGVDGAQPGIILPAHPQVGMAYRQEYYEGKAEDSAQVLSLDQRVKVPCGFFHAVVVKDYSPLKPKLLEHKFYARGVGRVLAVTVSGGPERTELVRFTGGREGTPERRFGSGREDVPSRPRTPDPEPAWPQPRAPVRGHLI